MDLLFSLSYFASHGGCYNGGCRFQQICFGFELFFFLLLFLYVFNDGLEEGRVVMGLPLVSNFMWFCLGIHSNRGMTRNKISKIKKRGRELYANIKWHGKPQAQMETKGGLVFLQFLCAQC